MYAIEATQAYEDEFEDLADRIANLAQDLEKGVYLTLVRTPLQGAHQVEAAGVWFRSQLVYPEPRTSTRRRSPFVIKVFYRVDEEQEKVVLISIKAIDATRM